VIHDDELKRVLHKWEAPEPGESLDRRVFDAWSASRRRPIPWKLWGAVAAGLVIAAAQFWPSGPKPPAGDPTRVETRLTASGFRPIPDGTVTVVKAKGMR